jgi:quercetin dioxygenase-like cupin family protein
VIIKGRYEFQVGPEKCRTTLLADPGDIIVVPRGNIHLITAKQAGDAPESCVRLAISLDGAEHIYVD